MNSTTFTLKGMAISPENISYSIGSILSVYLGECVDALRNSGKLQNLDLSNYYVGGENGPKVTKGIKKLLLKESPELKPIILEKFPRICHEIAQLYVPIKEIRAFWGDKSLLGKGIYENSPTCFADDGCNKTSRIFLEKFNRVRVLVCEDTDRPESSYRAVVYFGGGRNTFLTNFYAKNFPQNKGIMVEALRRILNLPKLSFKEFRFPLDAIYLNHDAIKCYPPERVMEFKGVGVVTCPHCDEVVPYSELHTDTSGNRYLIGCSEECAETGGITCCNCGDSVHEDDSYSYQDDTYCSGCYSEDFRYCEGCGEDYPIEQINTCQNGTHLCKDCSFTCEHCGNSFSERSAFEHDGDQYCEDCYSDKFSTCDECEYTFDRDEINGDDLCKDCAKIKEDELEKEDETIPQNAE